MACNCITLLVAPMGVQKGYEKKSCVFIQIGLEQKWYLPQVRPINLLAENVKRKQLQSWNKNQNTRELFDWVSSYISEQHISAYTPEEGVSDIPSTLSYYTHLYNCTS